MKNADAPANPISVSRSDDGGHITSCDFADGSGLTKREHFCLHAGVPATGDDELDEIIREGERRRIAGKAMNGALANKNGPAPDWDKLAEDAVNAADALLAEIEKGEG